MFRRYFGQFHRLIVVLALLCSGVLPVRAADPPAALMLVATPEFIHPLYGATVLVAHPIGDGQYLGFIINKPTTVTLGQAFPQHAPSQKVAAPIFLGGPEKANTLFALVHSEHSPGRGSYPIMRDLHVVVAGDTVDSVIEHDPDHARFLVGAVFWQKGELEVEIRRGAWYVEQPEADLMMRKETGNLWEELVDRHNGHGKFI
jgi:putative transcriptional regulator